MFCRHVFGNISGRFRSISRFLGNFTGFCENTWISRVRDRTKYQKPLNIRINKHNDHILSVPWHDLSCENIPSFLAVFERIAVQMDLVSIWTAMAIRSKMSSIQADWAICSKKLSSVWMAWAIHLKSVALFQKIQETHKIWHASEQNHFLFTSIREQYFQGVCKNLGNSVGGWFWKIQRGGGLIQQIPSMGVVWIFSRITQFEITTGTVILSFELCFHRSHHLYESHEWLLK